jgi:hypothetical protein
MAKPTVHKLPCLRYRLTDCAIYRPWQFGYTCRYPKLEIKDVSSWASPRIREFIIRESIFPSYKFKVKHREFIPIQGDKLERKWMDGTKKKSVDIPPYAILDMEQTAKDLRQLIDNTAFECIDEILEGTNSDELIRNTYDMARQHVRRAPVLTSDSTVRQQRLT